MRWDCITDDKRGMVGADLMAASILYFAMAAHGLYYPIALCSLFDVVYYGPQMLGPPSAAVMAALTML